MKRFHIFRAGKHRDSYGRGKDFSADDLRAMASAYDPKLHEAPIVIGHPSTDDPAFGWVRSVEFDESAGLSVEPHQVHADFEAMVARGRFKKVSSSFYLPDAEANPKPGVYYLRHVGFLGAQPPAVKGLRPVEFGEAEEGTVTVEFGEVDSNVLARLMRGLRELIIEKWGTETADRTVPDWELGSLSQETEGSPAFTEPSPAGAGGRKEKSTMADKLDEKEASLKSKETDLATKEADFAEREAALREQEKQAALRGAAEFVETLVKEGKVLPKDQAGVTAFLSGLDGASAVEFGEGDGAVKKPAGTFVREFLSGLPKQVSYGEAAGGGGKIPPDDPQAIADAAKALQFAENQKGITLSAEEAVRRVMKGGAK